MDPTEKDTIKSAIELLIEEIDTNIINLNDAIEAAIKDQDYESSKKISEEAIQLKGFKNKVISLDKDWDNLSSGKSIEKSARRRKKFKRGLKTPENEYYIPILSSIHELGGQGQINEILNKVYVKMKDILNDYDMKGLPKNPGIKRWYNTACWCRSAMVQEGFLSNDSPRGIWMITDKGNDYLSKNLSS